MLEDTIIRLCIPTEGEEGLHARLSDRFARAPAFTVVDTASDEVETFPNPERRHDHGRCTVATHLADRSVDAVACREIGRNSVASLSALRIAVYTTDRATVREVLETVRTSGLEAVGTQAL